MSIQSWLAPAGTLLILASYMLYLLWTPKRAAWRTHASLREDWFDAISAHPGSEILAVQTLRNSVMTATMTASTAALGLMGAVSLAAPTLKVTEFSAELSAMTPRNMLELTLMALLLFTLVASTMAIRHYHHAGFVAAMPVGSPARQKWYDLGKSHLRTAGVFYSWGLRCLILVAPVLAGLVNMVAGTVAALTVTGLLLWIE